MILPCPNAPHPAPPHMLETLPPLVNMPRLGAAVSAACAHCNACMARHQRAASQNPAAVNQAAALVLMYVAIVLNAHESDPGDTCEAMIHKAAPQTVAVLSEPTLMLLRSTPVETTTATPDGSTAASWDRELMAGKISELALADRERLWMEMLGLLMGIVLGEGRAREEQAG